MNREPLRDLEGAQGRLSLPRRTPTRAPAPLRRIANNGGTDPRHPLPPGRPPRHSRTGEGGDRDAEGGRETPQPTHPKHTNPWADALCCPPLPAAPPPRARRHFVRQERSELPAAGIRGKRAALGRGSRAEAPAPWGTSPWRRPARPSPGPGPGATHSCGYRK